ncbi:MAG: hypothetical protein ACE5EZ_03575 [Thermodesulfobacteriota bacterium]
MKQQFRVNTAETFRTYVFENNRRAEPSTAVITIYRPGSSEKLVDAAPMTISADGLLSYGLSVVENSQTGSSYKADITYQLGAETFYATLFYDVVMSKLIKVITDEDIINELPQLKDNGWRVSGTASGGSASTILDAELARYVDEYFTGGLATSLDKGETREITSFSSATGTVTTTAFSAAVVSGEKYFLRRSFGHEIQRAFEKIEEKIIRMGKRPELILDSVDLREVHIYFSVAEVCKGLVTERETFWWDIWKDYESRAEKTFENLQFKYDASGDGYITGSEADTRTRVRRTVRR